MFCTRFSGPKPMRVARPGVAESVAEPLGDRMVWVESRRPRHGHARGRHGNATVVILILPLPILEETDGFSVDTGEVLEFNEIHPPFPRFRLGDEGLGTGEQPSHFGLSESCIQSGLLQPFQKGAILANVEVGFQWRPQFLRATVYKGMHLYPKIEYSGQG